jgi:aminopeptidase N
VSHSGQGYLWDFAPCPPISSYIYALCAGDYAEVKNEDPAASTPMRIFCRKSKLADLDHKEVFRVIQLGMHFYEDLFKFKFPFDKYDIIYCPEFRIGAMENVGAVTFLDNFIKRPEEETA